MSKPFKFKERVIVSKKADWPGNAPPKNRKGRVWERDDDGIQDSVGVRFDEDIEGHDLGMDGPTCAMGHGWYVERKFIRRLPAKKA